MKKKIPTGRHVFRKIDGFKMVKICKSCGKKFHGTSSTTVFCDKCRN